MKNLGIKSRVIFLGTIPALLFAIILVGYAITNIFGVLDQSLEDRGKVIASQLAPAAEYGVISGVVVNGDGADYEMRGPEVQEIHAVGGLVFLRKGLIAEFPAMEDPFWDSERHRQVIAKGFKSGYSPRLPYLHMGAKFSIASPAWFTGA